MGLREGRCEIAHWIQLAHYSVQQQSSVTTVMKLLIP